MRNMYLNLYLLLRSHYFGSRLIRDWDGVWGADGGGSRFMERREDYKYIETFAHTNSI